MSIEVNTDTYLEFKHNYKNKDTEYLAVQNYEGQLLISIERAEQNLGTDRVNLENESFLLNHAEEKALYSLLKKRLEDE